MNNSADKNTLGGYDSIEEYVTAKTTKLETVDHNYGQLFPLMFSESDNVFYEYTEGFNIKKIKYGEAYERSIRISEVLNSHLKCPVGSTIGLYMKNGPEFIECMWSILRCGYNPLLMNAFMSREVLDGVLKQENVETVISDSIDFCIKTFSAEQIISEADALDIDNCDFTPAPETFGQNIYLMSSGTSRHIKICGYTCENIYYQIKDSAHIINECKMMKAHHNGYLKQLALLPFCHVFGLTAVYFWFAFYSRTFVSIPDLAPQTVVNTIRKHEVTHIFAVPLFWERIYDAAMKSVRTQGEKTVAKLDKGLKMYDKLAFSKQLQNDFSRSAFKEVREKLFGDSIRFMISGGGSISTEILRFFNATGYHLVNGYGTTEAGITSVELGNDSRVINSGTVGKPFNSISYKLENDELLIAGKSMSASIKNEGVTVKNNGWYHTHDLATVSDGHYFINGRIDDVIISSHGENLNPNIIEPCLYAEGVIRVCIIQSAKDGIVVIAGCDKYSDNLELIRKNIKEKAEANNLLGMINKIVIVDGDLIDGNEFKTDRLKIYERYETGFYDASEDKIKKSREVLNSLGEELRSIVSEVLEVESEKIGLDTDFFLELSCDSIRYLVIVAEIESKYHVSFPSIGEKSVSTIREILEYLGNEGAC